MIVALVSAETVLLVLALVLVTGLLRSHAEILRRLGTPADVAGGGDAPVAGADGGPAGAEDGLAGADGGFAGAEDGLAGAGGDVVPERSPRRVGGVPEPAAAQRGRRDARAAPIGGPTPSGDALSLDFRGGAAGPTLLAFLTSGCSGCREFWDTLGERRLPPAVQTVIVTRSPDRESPARLRSLAPAEVPVLMSSVAWDDYRIPGSPYFVLVDGWIRGEGVATNWRALASLVSDAIADQGASGPGVSGPGADREPSAAGAHRHAVGAAARHVGGGATGASRARRVDERFSAAGIPPGHPSLYPGDPPTGSG
ncbi:MAG: hypothetical protein ABSG43_19045 [Solirubrobacteraceae bacterium]